LSGATPLGDIIELVYGRGLPVRQRRNGTVPVYGSNGIAGYHSKAFIEQPTIIVGRKGSAGAVHLVTEPCFPIDTTYFVRRLEPDRVDLEYLYYVLGHLRLSRLATQTGVPGLNREDAYRELVPLPPLDEQRRIVDILNHAASIRRLREQAQAKAREIIPALFLDMFGDPATNPKGWRIAQVGDVYSTKRPGAKCGPFGSALKKGEYVGDGIPVWGIDNVAANEFVEARSLFITQQKYEELRPYSVMPGDILISRAGTVGRMCVARPKAFPSIIGTNLIRLALNDDLIIPEFFSVMFSYFAQRVGGFRATGEDTAYSFMKTSVLKAIKIPLPPIGYQKDFAQSLSEIAAVGEASKLFALRSSALTEALLHQSFNGTAN
jgi:type I restriction enzyme S subunit